MKYILILLGLIFFTTFSHAEDLPTNDIIELQQRLAAIGYPTIGADGVIGVKTINATRLFLDKDKIEEGDLYFALRKLRKSQNGYVILKNEYFEDIKKDIKNIEKSNGKTQDYLEETILNKVEASVSTAEAHVYSNMLNYVLLIIAGLAGGGFVTAYSIKKYIERRAEIYIKEKIDEKTEFIHQDIATNAQKSTNESKRGDAELFADLSYVLWLLKGYFESLGKNTGREQNTDLDKMCDALLIAQLRFAMRSVENAKNLPTNEAIDKQKERKHLNIILRTFSNAAFYFVAQDKHTDYYYPEARRIIKKIKPLIEKVDEEFIEGDVLDAVKMREVQESVIFVEDKLKITKGDQTKEKLDTLFSQSDDQEWISNVQKNYPHIQW